MQSNERAPLLAGKDSEYEYHPVVEHHSILQRVSTGWRKTALWTMWIRGDNRLLPVHGPKTARPTQKWQLIVLVLCASAVTLVLLMATNLFLFRISYSDSDVLVRPPGPSLPGWAPKRNTAYLIRAAHGAVATENKLCSDIGVDVLKDGGNAVDAAIAATLCIGVVNMFRYGANYSTKTSVWPYTHDICSSGIGGGGFMTVRLPAPSTNMSSAGWTVDFRETAPAAANSSMFSHDPQLSKFGGLSVGVPGELRGLAEAHRRWATLSWKRLVQPAVQLAEGWKVTTELARRIQVSNARWEG